MKKLFFILSVCAIVVGSSSCKKYTCACEDYNTGATTTSSISASNYSQAVVNCANKSTGSSSCGLQ